MTTKHTPGPWTAHGEQVTARTAHGDDAPVAAAAGGYWFPREAAANAQLIAAAPELYASLVELHDYLRERGSVADTLDMLTRSHNALAKAGRSSHPPKAPRP